MIDITGLASNIWTMIQPYLPILATKAADEIAKKVPEAVNKVWDLTTKKFETKPAAKEAVDDLAKSPEDPDTQASFRKELKKALAEDQLFAADLGKVLETAGDSYKATLSGDGAIAQGAGAQSVGKGGMIIGGNVTGNIVTGNQGRIDDKGKSKK